MIPFIIYSKRNFKIILFVLLLVIMPVAAAFFSGSNVIKKPSVGMYFNCNNYGVFNNLYSDSIEFKEYKNLEEMKRDIALGIIDSGYVFDEKFDKGIQSLNLKNSIDYISSKSSVIQPVANEFIFKAIIESLSPSIANKFLEKNNVYTDTSNYYNRFLNSDKVFNISFEKVKSEGNSEEFKFRLSSIFAVVILMGGFAAALILSEDRKNGIYKYGIISVFSYVFWLSLSAIVSSFICREINFQQIILYLIYMITVSLLAVNLSFLKRGEFICGMIPVVVFLSFGICPVIFDISTINSMYGLLGYILPITFFVKESILGMIIYCIIMAALYYILQRRSAV